MFRLLRISIIKFEIKIQLLECRRCQRLQIVMRNEDDVKMSTFRRTEIPPISQLMTESRVASNRRNFRSMRSKTGISTPTCCAILLANYVFFWQMCPCFLLLSAALISEYLEDVSLDEIEGEHEAKKQKKNVSHSYQLVSILRLR